MPQLYRACGLNTTSTSSVVLYECQSFIFQYNNIFLSAAGALFLTCEWLRQALFVSMGKLKTHALSYCGTKSVLHTYIPSIYIFTFPTLIHHCQNRHTPAKLKNPY